MDGFFHRVTPLRLLGLSLLFSFTAAAACAGEWPGWRGPTGVGLSDEKDLPLTWDGKSGQNVIWKVSLKGLTGHSSPIVFGDRLFLTTAAKQTREQEKAQEVPDHFVACYQVSDGKLLWNTSVPPGKQTAGYAIYAVPTPVTDGKAVYAWFGSAVLVALDYDGKILWRQERPGPFKLNPGIDTSPVLFRDTLLLLCDQGGGMGWLQALGKATGEVKWEQKRPKVSVTNSTPVLIRVNDKPELIVAASEQLQGLDPATGDLIWFCKARGFGSSPAYGSGLLYSDSGNGERAVVVDPTGKGDVTATHMKWHVDKVPSQYGSAVISGDYVYRATDKGQILCWKLSTGEQLFTADAKGVSKLSSPVAMSDGRVYFASSDTSYVIKAGPTFEVLATNNLKAGDNAASAAIADGKLFIRGNEFLYCIGKK